MAMRLTLNVMDALKEKYGEEPFTVEDVQDTVEKVLIENGHAATAKAYILYRAERTRVRETSTSLLDAVSEVLKETSRDNANVGQLSIG